MLTEFICPDNERIAIEDCLSEGGCRIKDRCATRSYLRLASSERAWKGKPSTTQLITGTMKAFLKLTKPYAVSPDSRAFMITGTTGHSVLEAAGDDLSILEEKFDDDVTGIADTLECECDINTLSDNKLSGSFKVAKAMGLYMEKEPTGEVYKKDSKTGAKKGDPKYKNVLKQSDDKIDMWEWDLQLNKYRMAFEKRGFHIDRLKIQCIVRDGGTYIAKNRGITKNVYYFDVKILPDQDVIDYFDEKKGALEIALDLGRWEDPCTEKENWDGRMCLNYCEVAEHCKLGRKLKEEEDG